MLLYYFSAQKRQRLGWCREENKCSKSGARVWQQFPTSNTYSQKLGAANLTSLLKLQP